MVSAIFLLVARLSRSFPADYKQIEVRAVKTTSNIFYKHLKLIAEIEISSLSAIL